MTDYIQYIEEDKQVDIPYINVEKILPIINQYIDNQISIYVNGKDYCFGFLKEAVLIVEHHKLCYRIQFNVYRNKPERIYIFPIEDLVKIQLDHLSTPEFYFSSVNIRGG